MNLNYVDFGNSAFEHRDTPAEYGEIILVTFPRVRQKYGWVPNAVEISLEPDLVSCGAPRRPVDRRRER